MRDCFLYLLLLLLTKSALADEAINVFVSILPQAYLTERIGQDKVEVQVMLQPGVAAETFDPAMKQIAKLNLTDIYFQIGIPFEKKWMPTFAAQYEKMKIVSCCEALFPNRKPELDNHVWVSPRNAEKLALQIKQELSALMPEHAEYFHENYSQLITDLNNLDQEIVSILRNRRHDYFVTTHASLGHFAEDYGLKQVALEYQGREPGPRRMMKIVSLARDENINTIFRQTGHQSPAAEVFDRELNIRTVDFDPLANDYLTNIRGIARSIAESLK